jgi:hypothetical protein
VNPLLGPVNPVRYPAAPNAPTQPVAMTTGHIAQPPVSPAPAMTKVMPSPTVRAPVAKPRRKVPVLGILITLVALALVGGVGYLGFAGGWLPRILGLPTQNTTVDAEQGQDLQVGPEPSDTTIPIVTPAANVTTPGPADQDDPLKLTETEGSDIATYHWDGTELFLHSNANVAFTPGKQIPSKVHVTGGSTYIDFSGYRFEDSADIEFRGIAGATFLVLPDDVNLKIEWSGAQGKMYLDDGLDGGKPWTNQERSGSRSITRAEGAPTLRVKLVSPRGSYTLGNGG